ncbi:MAG: nucleotidyltransferase domain-containing protein [Pseudomonadota bacterium]
MKTLDQLRLTEREKNAIKEATKLLKEKFLVSEVILFGSKARGDDDPESDIDLLLLTPEPLSWRERENIINTLFDVELTYDVVISIMDTTVSEWENGVFTVLPIHKNISRDGVVTA